MSDRRQCWANVPRTATWACETTFHPVPVGRVAGAKNDVWSYFVPVDRPFCVSADRAATRRHRLLHLDHPPGRVLLSHERTRTPALPQQYLVNRLDHRRACHMQAEGAGHLAAGDVGGCGIDLGNEQRMGVGGLSRLRCQARVQSCQGRSSITSSTSGTPPGGRCVRNPPALPAASPGHMHPCKAAHRRPRRE